MKHTGNFFKNLVFLTCAVFSLLVLCSVSFAETNKKAVAVEEEKSLSLSEQKKQLKKKHHRKDYVSDESFANFRAVTAGKIAPGKLYRSCNPVLNNTRAVTDENAAKVTEDFLLNTVKLTSSQIVALKEILQ